MGGYAGLSSRGQLTIPKKVRDALSLKAGDTVAWTVMDGLLIGTPRNPR
ncbi:MAG: AbrB/MazE/SpoVT family DNA-binding domain-containing protein, partial [Mesorhizobium sp.]